MKYLINRLYAILILLALAIPAQADSVRDVINALETPFRTATPAASAVHDVEADFTQESTIESLDRSQYGSGRVFLRFDRQTVDKVPVVKFRWEYDRPTRQEIVSDGRTMWVYLPDNNQVIESDVREISEARAQDPLTFLTGLGNLSRDFLIRWASPNRDADGNYILKLTPKTTTTMFRELQVTVDRRAVIDYTRSGVTGRDFPIRSTTAIDPNGNKTVITFERNTLRLNRGVSDLQFRFIMPAGVDVVRPSGDRMGY
jgi:outer membrane lipoprotein carrier protein